MEAKQVLIEKAALLLGKNPTTLLTESALLANEEERVMFNLFFSDFNSLLLELLNHIKPFIVADIERFLLPIKAKPLHRIQNLYEYYIDEFVNETPQIFTSAHVNVIGYSGNDEVKSVANELNLLFRNAQINCINDARRQKKIDLNESSSIVDFILLSWEGALYQQRNTGSIKSLFIFKNLLNQLLGL